MAKNNQDSHGKIWLPLSRSPELYDRAGLAADKASIDTLWNELSPFFGFNFERRHDQRGKLVSSLSINLPRSVMSDEDEQEEVDAHVEKWSAEACGVDPKLYAYMQGGWIQNGEIFPLVDSHGQHFRPPFFWVDSDLSTHEGTNLRRTWLYLGEYHYAQHPQNQGVVRENLRRNQRRTQALMRGRAFQTFSYVGEAEKRDLLFVYVPEVSFKAELGAFMIAPGDEKRCFSAVITGKRIHDLMKLLNSAELAVRTEPLYGEQGYFRVERPVVPDQRKLVEGVDPAKLRASIGETLAAKAANLPTTPVEPATPARTKRQQRMFEGAEAKKKAEAAQPTPEVEAPKPARRRTKAKNADETQTDTVAAQ